jgi:hypothetical protein
MDTQGLAKATKMNPKMPAVMQFQEELRFLAKLFMCFSF